MFLKKIVFRILPVRALKSLKRIYRKLIKAVHKPLSEEDYRNILVSQAGIFKGSVVFVHSSVDDLNIDFPASRLLEILLETVGDTGTLVFPAWHFTYRAETYLNQDLVFDVRRSPSLLGLLSELARRHPAAERSIHPVNSVVAIGRHAQEIIAEHGSSIYPCDECSPFYKIIKYRGIIVGIGVDAAFMSFVHCPEDVLKNQFPIKTRLDQVFEGKVKLQDGTVKIIRTLAAHPQIRHHDIRGFIKKYLDPSVVKNFTFRGNRFFVAHAKELFESIVDLSKENKTIYTDKARIRN